MFITNTEACLHSVTGFTVSRALRSFGAAGTESWSSLLAAESARVKNPVKLETSKLHDLSAAVQGFNLLKVHLKRTKRTKYKPSPWSWTLPWGRLLERPCSPRVWGLSPGHTELHYSTDVSRSCRTYKVRGRSFHQNKEQQHNQKGHVLTKGAVLDPHEWRQEASKMDVL